MPTPNIPLDPWPYPCWIAHRGAGTLAPENTLAAFRLGAEHGFGMFECDVKLSADGEPFLLHDSELDRTTNGQGEAGALNWDALSRLDAGSWHGRVHAGEPLLRLESLSRWLQALGRFLDMADSACLNWFMWAGGAWRPNYELNLEPIDGKDRPQIELIRSRM